MYLIEQLLDLLIGPEHPLIWGVLTALLGYLIYQHYQFSREMEEKWQEIINIIKENRHHHAESQEQLHDLKDILRQELQPLLRDIERDIQNIEDLEQIIIEAKSDQRGWFTEIRDDFNQFRSEFRDILKIFLNGRKRD